MKILIPQGGLGDVLSYTVFFKQQFEKTKKKINIFVNTDSEFELLFNNPYINLFLYEHFITEKEPRILKTSLNDHDFDFFEKKFLNSRKKIINFNCNERFISLPEKKLHNVISNMFGYDDVENGKPQIFLNYDEIKNGKNEISKYNFPICINTNSNCDIKKWDDYKWEKMIKFYPKFNFLQIGKNNENTIKNTIDLRSKSLREQLSILFHCNFFIGIDSFWNHAAKALNVKSIILFGPTDPKIHGYDENINIYKRRKCSPCMEWGILECPYGKKCMNDIHFSDVKKAIDELILKNISGFGV
jgi:ADP-heptose:LPS heptosyltransferase